MQDQNPDYYLKAQSYLKRIISLTDTHMSKFQNAHIMMLYFCVNGLDVLNKLSQIQKQNMKNYVLSLQIAKGGWMPSSFYTHYAKQCNLFAMPHIVFTYSALNILKISGGLQMINRDNCLRSVQRCQKHNGSYSNFQNSEEADLRFVYAAVAIYHMLGDFQTINKLKTIEYINKCRNFDGGYGLRPNCQSHCGAIYCAVSALKLLQVDPLQKDRTLNFLVNRQIQNLGNKGIVGMQGRVGKLPDSCYTFWGGASIMMLTGKNLMNAKVQSFLRLCFKEDGGGFSKYPTDHSADLMHTLHSLVGRHISRGQLHDFQLQKGVRNSLTTTQ